MTGEGVFELDDVILKIEILEEKLSNFQFLTSSLYYSKYRNLIKPTKLYLLYHPLICDWSKYASITSIGYQILYALIAQQIVVCIHLKWKNIFLTSWEWAILGHYIFFHLGYILEYRQDDSIYTIIVVNL